MADKTMIKEESGKNALKNLIVIRIRSAPKMNGGICETLRMLKLSKRHSCAVIPDTPSFRGMIKKVSGYVTWGEGTDEIIKILERKKKKGSESLGLSSPKKGVERKGIKINFGQKGALGYRGSKINKFVERMV